MDRDDFTKETRAVIARRAAYLCSRPECRKLTVGPHSNPEKSLTDGVAAHICAASSGGPRYDPHQTINQRKSTENGIWLCHNCSDLVDKDCDTYPAELLRKWKTDHDKFVAQDGGPPDLPRLHLKTLSGLTLPESGSATIRGVDVKLLREHKMVIENIGFRPLRYLKGRIQFPERVIHARVIERAVGESVEVKPDRMEFIAMATGNGSVSVSGGLHSADNYKFAASALPPHSKLELRFISIHEDNMLPPIYTDAKHDRYFHYVEGEFQYSLGVHSVVRKFVAKINFDRDSRIMKSECCQDLDGSQHLVRIDSW